MCKVSCEFECFAVMVAPVSKWSPTTYSGRSIWFFGGKILHSYCFAMVVFFLRHVRKQFLRLLLVLWSNKDGPSEVQHPSIAVGLEVVGARSSRKIGLGYLGCQFARFFTNGSSAQDPITTKSHLKLSKTTQWMEMTQEFGHGLFVFAALRKVWVEDIAITGGAKDPGDTKCFKLVSKQAFCLIVFPQRPGEN